MQLKMFVKTFSAWKQRFAIILYLIHRFHLLPVYLWWYRKIMLEIVWCLLDHFYVITSPHVHACFLTHLVHHMATQKGCVLLLYEWMPSVDGVTKQGLQHSWTEGSDESTEREICIRYMQAWAPLCARNVSRFLSLLLYTTQLHIIVYNYMPIANKERSQQREIPVGHQTHVKYSQSNCFHPGSVLTDTRNICTHTLHVLRLNKYAHESKWLLSFMLCYP